MEGKLKGKIRAEEVPVEKIVLLKKNAHFMEDDEYGTLKGNIEADGALTSCPFCIYRTDGTYECISGNHRVTGARDCKLDTILCLVVDEGVLSEDDKARIQLSHNAIHGKDDKTILREIYESIKDLNIKALTGLNELTFNISDFSIPSITPKGLKTGVVTLLFLEGEEDHFAESEQYLKTVCGSSDTYLAKYGDYDTFLKEMGYLKKALNIKNHAALILYLVNQKCEELHARERKEA